MHCLFERSFCLLQSPYIALWMVTECQQTVICLMALALTLSYQLPVSCQLFQGKHGWSPLSRSLGAMKPLFSVFRILLQMVHWRLAGVQQDLWWWHAHEGRALHQEGRSIWGGDAGLQGLLNTPACGERVLQQPVMSTSVGSFGLVWSKEIWGCVFWDVLVIYT